jgi:4-hydroxy-tetrahydrodipicolinate synthase
MQLSGTITALATPFEASGAVDLNAWVKLLRWQIASGISAVVVAGSTGEAAALTEQEYVALIQLAAAEIAGKMPVIAGTGQSNTAKTIIQTQLAKSAGADIALVVTPPYVRPTPAGLVQHYLQVAEQGGLPVVLYNVPGRTGCDMQPETVEQLYQHPNIVALKEARGDEARWDALHPLANAQFVLLSGDDPTFVRAAQHSAKGLISVASNVLPGTLSRISRHLISGETEAARALDSQLQGIYDFLGCEPNPIPVKAILAALGIGHGLRLPLTSLSSAHSEALNRMTAQCKALELTP